MLTLKNEKECDYIVKNVVSACKDINKLTKAGYNYLYLASGFIAHYNLYGFIDYYTRASLKDDIRKNSRQNQWDNFMPGDRDYAYHMQKRDIYNRIMEKI